MSKDEVASVPGIVEPYSSEPSPVAALTGLLLALHQGLDKPTQRDARVRDVVDQRFFGTLSEAGTAKLPDVHIPTVRRDWVKARAWFQLELGLGSWMFDSSEAVGVHRGAKDGSSSPLTTRSATR